MLTKPRTNNMELYEKWMKAKLSKDPIVSTYDKANKRIRINISKKQTKIDKWSIYRESNRSHMANINNKK